MTPSAEPSNVTSHELSLTERVFETTILSIIIVVAITGNVAIWIIVLKSKALRTVTNMFMLGLSAADLLVSMVNMPVTIVAIVLGYWPLSRAACVGMGFTNMTTLVASVMSLCNISINRYMMVCRPSSVHSIYTKLNAMIMITVVFAVSAILASLPLIGWGGYTYIPKQSFCFCDWPQHVTYAAFMIGACFCLPFSIMLVCNVFICRAVRQSALKVNAVHGNGNNNATDAIGYSKDVSTSFIVHNNHTDKRRSAVKDADLENVLDNRDLDTESGQISHVYHEDQRCSIGKDTRVKQVQVNDTEHKASGSTSNGSNRVSGGKEASERKPKQSMSQNGRRSEEIRLAKSLILVVLCFILFWLPYCICIALSSIYPADIPRWFQMFAILLGYANSGLNPIIYGLMNKRYASGFRDLFCWWKAE